MANRSSPTLSEAVARARPDISDPIGAIAAGHVAVNGIVVTNPRSRLRPGSSVVVQTPTPLRGEAKLRAALDEFEVPVRDAVAVDVGAAAGGFTRVLLGRGASRVYAVDVGHGQLLGSLRQDPRVVNLEATNVSDLDIELVPEPVDLVTIDVSYLSLAAAVGQLGGLQLRRGAHLVGLVKPMFELRLPAPPTDEAQLPEALALATTGIESAGWRVLGSIASPVLGSRGAREMLVHAVIDE